MSKELIQGVKVRSLNWIPDERGRLMEILRCDDPLFNKFGQAYVTTTYPGVVKAWHFHKLQDDYFTCISGMIKLVIYDQREESPTYHNINEFFIGDHNQKLIIVPKFCYHGWKCISNNEAVVLNLVTEPYNYENPDEYRLDPHYNDVILYDWTREDG